MLLPRAPRLLIFSLGVVLLGSLANAQCADLLLKDGSPWHDKSGPKYTCAKAYPDAKKCKKFGDKFMFEGLKANDACCMCGGGGKCTPEVGWTHPTFKDKCSDYAEGGKSYKYRCDKKSAAACCSCTPEKANVTSDGCVDKTQPNGNAWHDSYVGPNTVYDCAKYQKKGLCGDGNKYENFGMTAAQACCACGGGTKAGGGGVVVGSPKVNLGDNIKEEWMGGTKFNHKKHLKGGYILYWNTDKEKKKVTFGLLSPADMKTPNTYIALGVSPSGFMAGAHSVVAWINSSGKAVIKDYTLQNQSPSGVKETNLQLITGADLTVWEGRLALVYTRPWASEGTVEIKPTQEYTKLIYSTGPISSKCSPICSHAMKERWTAVVALTAPPGMSTYDLNKGDKDEPCNGPAKLECTSMLSCYHEFAASGDVFASNDLEYGVCMKASDLGDKTSTDKLADESWQGVQRVFDNDGGFEKKINLQGGFVLMWTLNKNSDSGDFAAINAVKKNDELAGANGPAICACIDFTANGPACFQAASSTCMADFAGTAFCKPCMEDRTSPACTENFMSHIASFKCPEKWVPGGLSSVANATAEDVAAATGTNSTASMIAMDTVTVALISTMPNKQGWIGMGWTPTGLMKGSDVVIGWSSGQNTHIGDYFLREQVPNYNKPSNKQGIFNERVIKKNGQTALVFERPLAPRDSVQFFKGLMKIIYASGPLPNANDKEFIPYHIFRAPADVAFLPYPEELAEAAASAENELCMGPENIKCKKGLMCLPIPEAVFETDLFDQLAGMSMDGFTSNNDFTTKDLEVFKDKEKLRGMGSCMSLDTMMTYADYDMTKLGQVQALKESDYQHKKNLAFGIDLYWSAVGTDRIKIGLVTQLGRGWLALGMGTQGTMVGATAVQGWRTIEDLSVYKVQEFYLQGKLPWDILPTSEMRDPKYSMYPENMKLTNIGHENALTFERPLIPNTGVAPIVKGVPNTVIFAHGPLPNEEDTYFGYHKFRDSETVTFFE